ncbi:MAG TPA: aldo/keto reductase [Chthoniobacteraceae bacterium]|nr:aldo/keto reductase [Chthoniobacteraceae bacterium]
MKTRLFNKTGVHVSEIGLGCWQLGGSDWGDVDEKLAHDILSAAVDSGINFLDTADVYGGGRSEQLIGNFLKSRSEKIFTATKLGRKGIYPDNYTRETLNEATESSLKNLGVDALDLTQLHCVPLAELRKGDVFQWLREQKQQGKIKSFGASVETMEQALACLDHEGLSSLQIIFNLFRQNPADVLFKKALEKQVAIIVRLPLASGLLSGKLTKDSRFPQNDHRNYNRDGQYFSVGETFGGIPFEKGVELADALKPRVPGGMTMAQMAQRWILDHEAVSVVITGASRVAQVTANASVSALPPLDSRLRGTLRDYYENEVKQHIRSDY